MAFLDAGHQILRLEYRQVPTSPALLAWQLLVCHVGRGGEGGRDGGRAQGDRVPEAQPGLQLPHYVGGGDALVLREGSGGGGQGRRRSGEEVVTLVAPLSVEGKGVGVQGGGGGEGGGIGEDPLGRVDVREGGGGGGEGRGGGNQGGECSLVG